MPGCVARYARLWFARYSLRSVRLQSENAVGALLSMVTAFMMKPVAGQMLPVLSCSRLKLWPISWARMAALALELGIQHQADAEVVLVVTCTLGV